MSLSEIGVASGGALLVYLAPGDTLPDGRTKYDQRRPDDAVLVSNMEGVWDIGRHLDEWAAAPNDGPALLLAIHGPVSDRHIVGAAPIDTTRWLDPDLKVPDRNRWNVPLHTPVELNANGLRDRKVDGVRFGQFSWQLHIWVDAAGVQRHPHP